jgi:hypothetical protein
MVAKTGSGWRARELEDAAYNDQLRRGAAVYDAQVYRHIPEHMDAAVRIALKGERAQQVQVPFFEVGWLVL